MPKRKKKPPAPPKFAVGDSVRVKHGIKDADYPDMPLGGWAGTVAKVEKRAPRMHLVRWSEETLASIHPVFKQRCERDGTGVEEYWLEEGDLEPDTGGPLDIERPKKITTKPLLPEDQDNRIRKVFDLTSNDPLPDVDDETLWIYHQHLSASLSFPFQAEHTPVSGTLFRTGYSVKVVGFDDSDEPMIDETDGILCEARHQKRVVIVPLGELKVGKGNPNRRLVADYCYWFGNWR